VLAVERSQDSARNTGGGAFREGRPLRRAS
jgi:hypothetical protein